MCAHVVRTASTWACGMDGAWLTYRDALESYIETLQGENETLMKQLAASDARAEKLEEKLAAEQAKTARAIAEFVALGRKMAKLTSERRARLWWWRLVGLGARE